MPPEALSDSKPGMGFGDGVWGWVWGWGLFGVEWEDWVGGGGVWGWGFMKLSLSGANFVLFPAETVPAL